MTPIQIDVNALPKQFCEKIIVGSNNQMFMLVALVGANATAYSITPEHAKNLVKILSEHVAKFEKEVRVIPDATAGVPSPIQSIDLGSDGKGKPKK